jgi:hypothetical protein
MMADVLQVGHRGRTIHYNRQAEVMETRDNWVMPSAAPMRYGCGHVFMAGGEAAAQLGDLSRSTPTNADFPDGFWSFLASVLTERCNSCIQAAVGALTEELEGSVLWGAGDPY